MNCVKEIFFASMCGVLLIAYTNVWSSGDFDDSAKSIHHFECSSNTKDQWFPIFGLRFYVPDEYERLFTDAKSFVYRIEKERVFDMPLEYTERAIDYGKMHTNRFQDWLAIDLNIETSYRIKARTRTSTLPDGKSVFEMALYDDVEYIQISSTEKFDLMSVFGCLS